MPDTRFEPANICIYCGATRYAPDNNRYLAEEHIIPLGLNGSYILPKASCRRCERITGNVETKVLRGALLGCRTHLNLQTRRPKDRPKSLPLFDQTRAQERRVMVPIEDYPANLLLLAMDTPYILRASQPVTFVYRPWHYLFVDKTSVLRRLYGITSYATSSLDTFAFGRMLAKIGHSFAISQMGVNGFLPVLADLILNDVYTEQAANALLQYVGGVPDPQPKENLLHVLSFEDPTPDTLPFVIVRIRLFAMLGAPIYRVVVGHRLRQPVPPITP
jgi:hypothetical protein